MPRWPACPRSAERVLLGPQPGGIVLWLLFCLLLPPLLLGGEGRVAQAGCGLIADLAAQGAYGVADSGGRVADSCNADRPLVPASVIKIATVAAALRILGPEYRFLTEFHVDGRDNLYLKGFGDPTLLSEEIASLIEQLRQKGLRRVSTLYLDVSAFALASQVPGREDSANPYDAPVGPLSVNFNSAPIRKTPAGSVVSAEPQTPTLPIMETLGRNQPVGQSRVNICAGDCNADARMAQYAGELFQALLQQGGVPVDRLGGIRAVPAQGATLLHGHRSRQTLRDISRSLLHYSSNFMANLVFLACGARRFGYPATWQKAERAVREELVRQLGRSLAQAIVQVDGAGLSRDNRVTVRSLLALLDSFRPQAALLPKEGGAAVKTGTLTGVYNLAGFLPGGQAFVILLNQETNSRSAVLDRLKHQYAATGAPAGKMAGASRDR